MNQIKFCKRCLYGDTHPLGLTIDTEGVCSGCRIHEEKDSLDWNYRWSKLEGLVSQYKSNTGKNYDCIIPVSGAGDSYYIVYLAKFKLGLNPLLVTYNKYFNTELGIRNLTNLRTKFDCDILFQNVNPLSVKKITRETFQRFGSIYWHCIAGQTVFPVQVAVKYKIPLILWGAHQGIEQTGMFSHEHEVEMTRRYRKNHDLMGYEAEDLISPFSNLSEGDVWQYFYPQFRDIDSIGVRGVYLGNYVRWDPLGQHELMVDKFNYKTTKFNRTFDVADYVDCYNYINLHDYLKLSKHGYSKITDHATREIRHGRITREHGIHLVRSYELHNPKHLELFCDWLNIDRQGLDFMIKQFQNNNFWTEKNLGEKIFNGWSKYYLDNFKIPNDDVFLGLPNLRSLDSNMQISKNGQEKYITFGRGLT